MKGCRLWWLWLLLAPSAMAKQLDWQVLPTTCIVENQGEQCTMSITIKAKQLPQGDYCLLWQQHLLQCWQRTRELKTNTTLHFRQDQTLTLIDANQQVIFDSRLTIKALQGQSQRRRIRSPWSIF